MNPETYRAALLESGVAFEASRQVLSFLCAKATKGKNPALSFIPADTICCGVFGVSGGRAGVLVLPPEGEIVRYARQFALWELMQGEAKQKGGAKPSMQSQLRLLAESMFRDIPPAWSRGTIRTARVSSSGQGKKTYLEEPGSTYGAWGVSKDTHTRKWKCVHLPTGFAAFNNSATQDSAKTLAEMLEGSRHPFALLSDPDDFKKPEWKPALEGGLAIVQKARLAEADRKTAKYKAAIEAHGAKVANHRVGEQLVLAFE